MCSDGTAGQSGERVDCKQFGGRPSFLPTILPSLLEGEVSTGAQSKRSHSGSMFRQLPLDSVPTMFVLHRQLDLMTCNSWRN